jgi:ABC-type multidrug transport system permease subunit
MDRGDVYATLVLPAELSARTAALAGGPAPPGAPALPEVELLSNVRAGTEAATLARGTLEPALAQVSKEVGARAAALARAPLGAAARAALADPIEVTERDYRPLPDHAALGLSAFYAALLVLMCGFLSAAIVNGVVDGELGFAPTEFGPFWTMKRPVALSRWQTLLAKWAIAATLAAFLTALMLLIAAVLLNMDAPEPLLLWAFGSVCAITVAVGTLSLIAAFGTQGQLLALIIFIYLGLAAAGGTVPAEALPAPLASLGDADPLRQILGGTRSILYFDSRVDAGLGAALTATGIGLAFWLGFGAFVSRLYDRKGRYRIDPGLLEHINRSADEYVAAHPPARESGGTHG